MLLKETKISARRAPLLYQVESCIEKRGNIRVDTPVFTKDGELLVTAADGAVYMLKKWYAARECDIRQESEAARAAQQLALLHRELEAAGCECAAQFPVARDPVDEIRRHNQELKKVRAFIRSRPVKSEFEYLFLDSFDKMYGLAETVLTRMEASRCRELCRDSVRRSTLAHGEYNYHNLLMMRDGMAVTNFERMHIDIQVHDLYYFIRKAMEKHHWKLKSGQKMLEAYETVRPLSADEKEYLGLSLAYPEKFWKTAGNYYRSNKAWIPAKYVEKLELAVHQCEEKNDFLEELF